MAGAVPPQQASKEQLLVGQPAEVSVDNRDFALQLRGYVMDLPAKEIHLIFPGLAGAPVGLEAGQKVGVKFWSRQGVHNAKSTLLRVTSGTWLTIAISRFAKIETVQRRRFFRVSACLPVSFGILSSSTQPPSAKEDEIQALTQDVSAGGLRMDVTVPLAPGDRLRLSLATPRAFRRTLPASLATEAKVVRTEESTRNDRRVYSVSVEFVFPAERERDRWVQFTFDLQRGIKL